jgi:hypothetical protein
MTVGSFMPLPAGGGVIAEVGSGSQRANDFANGVDSLAVAYPGNVTQNNLLICAGQAFKDGGSVASVSVTDSRSTSYTVLSWVSTGSERMWIAYGIAPSSGACTVTVNPSNATDDLSFSIDEFSGVNTSTPLDVDGGNSSNTGTDVSEAITTGVAGALIVGCMGYDGATTTITVAGGLTEIGEHEDNGTDECHGAGFKIVGAAGAYTVDWTLGASKSWQCMSASFKPA